jgi:flagellar basal body rod protein FlgG
MKGLMISGSALRPAFLMQQVLANNLANASVTGFRAQRPAFHEVLDAWPPEGTDTLSRPSVVAALDLQEGPLEVTGDPLDLALVGEGFFAVSTEEGERYTRAGDFVMGPDGTVQTRSGARLETESGPLVLSSPEDLQVRPEGSVLVRGQPAGRLRIVRFTDPSSLHLEGEGLFSSEAEAEPARDYQVLQGRLEGANVSPLLTMVEMISLLRFVEANQKAFQAQDAALEGLLRWAMR